MNYLVKFLLQKICRKLVIQGYSHRANIVAYYRVMHDAAAVEFSEDNQVTLNAFLRECHVEGAMTPSAK